MSTLLPKDKAQYHKDNRTNKTGFIGVRYNSHYNVFQAYIRVAGRKEKVYCGQAKTAEEAARKYDQKAIEIFGKNAVTNFNYDSDKNDNLHILSCRVGDATRHFDDNDTRVV